MRWVALAAAALAWFLLPAPVRAAGELAAPAACSRGLTITVHPGLPPSSGRVPFRVAPDIPRGPLSLSLPLYPEAAPLTTSVAPALWEYPETPYLQTGVAEFNSTAAPATVESWYKSAFAGCGWLPAGRMNTTTSVLSTGFSYLLPKAPGRSVQTDLSFGRAPDGGTYIAYAVIWVQYPPRPASSYLHGPFNQVRIAYRLEVDGAKGPAFRTVHVVVRDHALIHLLVHRINALSDLLAGVRTCVMERDGPAWLTFLRPNGTAVHAWSGNLCGGVTVAGSRPYWDRGAVWNLITRIVHHSSGRG